MYFIAWKSKCTRNRYFKYTCCFKWRRARALLGGVFKSNNNSKLKYKGLLHNPRLFKNYCWVIKNEIELEMKFIKWNEINGSSGNFERVFYLINWSRTCEQFFKVQKSRNGTFQVCRCHKKYEINFSVYFVNKNTPGNKARFWTISFWFKLEENFVALCYRQWELS